MPILQVRRFVAGSTGAHGNAEASHADPVDWQVYGMAPGRSRELSAGRDLSEVAWTVFAPASDATPTERDLVVVDDVEYPVNGRPEDWAQGPTPGGGVVVELLRVEG